MLGDVGAEKTWRPKQWRDRLDVIVDEKENKTSAELRADLIQYLIDNGVRIMPPLIEGEAAEVETVGVARIAGPDNKATNLTRVRCWGQTGHAKERGSRG